MPRRGLLEWEIKTSGEIYLFARDYAKPAPGRWTRWGYVVASFFYHYTCANRKNFGGCLRRPAHAHLSRTGGINY